MLSEKIYSILEQEAITTITIQKNHTSEVSFLLFFSVLLEDTQKDSSHFCNLLRQKIEHLQIVQTARNCLLDHLNFIQKQISSFSKEGERNLNDAMQNSELKQKVKDLLESIMEKRTNIKIEGKYETTFLFKSFIDDFCDEFGLKCMHQNFYLFSCFKFYQKGKQLNFHVEENKKKKTCTFILLEKAWNFKNISEEFVSFNFDQFVRKSDSFVVGSDIIESIPIHDGLLENETFLSQKLCESIVFDFKEDEAKEEKEGNEEGLESPQDPKRKEKKSIESFKSNCLQSIKKLNCISKAEILEDSKKRKKQKPFIYYY